MKLLEKQFFDKEGKKFETSFAYLHNTSFLYKKDTSCQTSNSEALPNSRLK